MSATNISFHPSLIAFLVSWWSWLQVASSTLDINTSWYTEWTSRSEGTDRNSYRRPSGSDGLSRDLSLPLFPQDEFLAKVLASSYLCIINENSLANAVPVFRHGKLTLMEAMSMACQRQLCCGNGAHTRDVIEPFLRIFWWASSFFYGICTFLIIVLYRLYKYGQPRPHLESLETWYRNIDLWALVSKIILRQTDGNNPRDVNLTSMTLDTLPSNIELTPLVVTSEETGKLTLLKTTLSHLECEKALTRFTVASSEQHCKCAFQWPSMR